MKRGQAETMRTMLVAASQLLERVPGTEVARNLIDRAATDLLPSKGALRQRKYVGKADALLTQTSVIGDVTGDAQKASSRESCASRAASESLSSPRSAEILGAEEKKEAEEKRVAEGQKADALLTHSKRVSVTPKVTPPTASTWDAYSTAYRARYSADPLRNAMVNGQLASFLRRVPGDEAPHIAQHYVASNNARYVSAGHAVSCLLQDAEKLRTEWLTGRSGTAHAARTADRTSGRAQQYEQTFAQLRAEDREAKHG